MVIRVIIGAILPPLIAKKQSVESVLPWDHTKSPTFELTASYHFFYGVFMTTTFVFSIQSKLTPQQGLIF